MAICFEVSYRRVVLGFQIVTHLNLKNQEFAIAKLRPRLYLIVALAVLFATVHGMTVQLKGLRTQVDPHYRRGLSYLKIGIRWLKGVISKGRDLFTPIPLFSSNLQPCFASKRAKQKYYDAIWFTRISELKCFKV